MSVVDKMYRESLENKKVFMRSNEDDDLIVGFIVDFEEFGGTVFPVVKSLSDNKEYRGGLVFSHSEQMEIVLKTMTAREQWDFLVDIVQTQRALDHLKVQRG